jgi:sporulation protein YlmC with PRC-barrel domain
MDDSHPEVDDNSEPVLEMVDDSDQAAAATAVARVDFAEWHGKDLVDASGEKIGKLEDVYFDIETDQPQFGTVKEGSLFVRNHLTFVPLLDVTIGPDYLQVAVSRDQVKDAPNIELEGDELSQADETALYHHYRLNYAPASTPSGRRLARR